ncbi:head-tail connector protein [Companilactobacillus bobalius]|uniref:head-tail connector protein n=1 Tax=Companilactobacillus bobalius TaxID=2801451 RepID=UPI001302BBE9|nr:head-tail connector protein [Companilactobacillus bobalius]KAE9560660.1 hypothetical protein ATN92_11020 [Companilactobacillus bobalius]
MDDSLLSDLKLSLRLDPDEEEDMILNRNLIAAESYVKGAIGNDDGLMEGFYELDSVKQSYEIAVIALASSYYTFRSSGMTGRITTLFMTLDSIIAQFRGKYL